jgi:hypothetical protein
MGDHRKSLRTVGTALIIVGVLDIAWMVYCIAAWMSYRSSFNIFAVVAGVLLRRGSLATARVVAGSSAFFIAGIAGVLLALPILAPLDLLWTYLTLHPLAVGAEALFLAAMLVFLTWVYRRLTASDVLAAMDEGGIERKRFGRRPSTGFVIGALLGVVLLVAARVTSSGAMAEEAKVKARSKVGGGYKLCVASVGWSSTGGRTTVDALVIAYNPHEIRPVKIRWEE